MLCLLLANSIFVKKEIMTQIHPQFINDSKGNKTMVILPYKEYAQLVEELDLIEDLRLYEEAKKRDTGERIPFEKVLKKIEAKRKNKK